MVYDKLYTALKPQSIPQAVLILANYQSKIPFVADQEINLLACFTEIMHDCQFN
jgi:replication factor C small subunit